MRGVDPCDACCAVDFYVANISRMRPRRRVIFQVTGRLVCSDSFTDYDGPNLFRGSGMMGIEIGVGVLGTRGAIPSKTSSKVGEGITRTKKQVS